MPGKLFIANLSKLVGREELEQLFAGHGTVRSVRLPGQGQAANGSCTGFVEMDTEEHGRSAITGLNGLQHRGLALNVSWAKPGQTKGINFSRLFESMDMFR